MSAYPGDHSVVVLDNCRIHHSAAFKSLVEDAGGYVLYTPPYTPKHNPIESVFGKIKAWLRRNDEWVETVRGAARCAAQHSSRTRPS
jgi:transposase